jgi:hypothetical protein
MNAARSKPPAYALQGKRLPVFGLDLQATDVFIQAWLVLTSLLAILFHSRIKDPWTLVLKNTIYGLLYLGAIVLYRRASHRGLKFLIRAASVQLIFFHLFVTALPLQLIFWRNWQDQIVLNLEQAVFGVQPTVWLEKFISPGLTEWMMFSYVIYLPAYPVLCGILYFKRSERHMEDYLFTLAITNFVCDAGFLLFPVAGPLFKIADQYTVPLKGYFFTFWGEFIRNHVHDIGGCIPSPHCAVATVMAMMAYRYDRPTFILLSPVILSLYVAAFYGRFHYLSDVVIGILAAWFVLRIVPSLMRRWNAWLDRRLHQNA